MTCDEYSELLSARLDGALTGDEERALEEHQTRCPDCRAAGAQLAALRSAFDELEDIPAPEGFAQGVMDRIRAVESEKKIIPLFKRPQFRALAGLAACAVLAVGLYGAVRQPPKAADAAGAEDFGLMARSFSQDALVEDDNAAACESLPVPADEGILDAPLAAAYSLAPEGPETTETDGISQEKSAPNAALSNGTGDWAYAEVTLTLDRMPEGGWELIPPDTFVSPVGLTVSVELMEQLEQLAVDQGISVSRISGPEVNDHCLIIILDEEN